jgi:hypothetical protein
MGKIKGKNVKPIEKRWLTSAEAMEYIGVGKNVLANIRQSGEIAISRIGNKYLYSLKSIEEYIEKNRIV